MLIQNKNLVIRNAAPGDASILCKWWNDGKVMAHAGFPNGLGTSEEAVMKQISMNMEESHQLLIIENNKVPIGEMSYSNQGNEIAEIGIKICDFSEHAKGYGKKLLSMLINTLFKDLGYRKIILDTNVNNLIAQRVYEKLGFQKIRVNTDAWKDQLGNMQSSIDYELEEKDFINYCE